MPNESNTGTTLNIDALAEALAARLKPAALESMTLTQFSLIYMQRHAKPHNKTWLQDEALLRLYVLPALGTKQLTDIKPTDVLELQSNVCNQTTPSRSKSGGKFQSNRCVDLLGRMLRLARTWGQYPEDKRIPTEGIRGFAEPSRERFVSHEEMTRLAAAIDDVKAPHLRVLFWLYLLLGLRKSELLLSKWSDVSLEDRVLSIPGDRRKNWLIVSTQHRT